MSDEPAPRGLTLNAFATIAALLMSGSAVIYSLGIQAGQITENRRRIDALETKNDRRDETIQRVDVRTARIEERLRVIIPDGELEGR